MFSSPLEHLRAELGRLDLLIHREILRLRANYHLSLDEFRGLYISNEQVDALVRQTAAQSGHPDAEGLTARAKQLRVENDTAIPHDFPWSHVAREFDLSPVERDILLLAMAPEIDLKYETLYSYLHNDVTRKAPSQGLAVRLLATSAEDRIATQRALAPQSTLLRDGLLAPLPDPRPRVLGQEFTVAPPVARWLIDADPPSLLPETMWSEIPLAESTLRPLRALSAEGPPVVFSGDDHVIARRAAEAACCGWKLPLLVIDLLAEESLAALSARLRLTQRLRRQGVLLWNCERHWLNDATTTAEARRFASSLADIPGPLFLHFTSDEPWPVLLRGLRVLHFPIEVPDFAARREVWSNLLRRRNEAAGEAADELASRFVLPAGRIEAAVLAASDRRDLEEPGQPIRPERLFEAARTQSERALGRLARKVPLVHTWEDLVLPPATLAHLHEVSAAAKHRYLVYSTWGLGGRRLTGTGVKVLFAGSSGTGKTMSASVIARDLGLDLYQVDLSGVVSKYIGETEKNLNRIFRAARGANAVLFFDEADALFGKRSEVKDAHDRYSNIEVAYLLQKLDEHEGVTILASNLSRNIDEAFSRRLQYLVEFPLPDEPLRLRLWRKMFPPEAPLAPDVDLEFLAHQFRLAGGDIRNVALAAAFLAADNGGVINMELLVSAMARQMIKQGKVPSPSEFKQYYASVGRKAEEREHGWETEGPQDTARPVSRA